MRAFGREPVSRDGYVKQSDGLGFGLDLSRQAFRRAVYQD